MLSNHDLERYFNELQLSAAAREYVREVRESEPARRIGDRATSNVCVWVASRKMGRRIGAESGTVEAEFVLDCEWDDEVIEYWDQPQPVQPAKHIKTGAMRRYSYTPDFLVLTRKSVTVIETKSLAEADELVMSQPKNWIKDGTNYRYVSAEIEFTRLGIAYKVITYDRSNVVRTANIKLLLQAQEENPANEDSVYRGTRKILRERCCASICDIATALGISDYTPLYSLIAKRRLFALIDEEPLFSPTSAYLASSASIAREFKAIRENEKRHTPKWETAVVPLERVPTEAAAKRALAALERVESGDKGRSVRRWKGKIEEGRLVGKTAFQSLVANYQNCGNRRQRIFTTVEDYLSGFLKEHWAGVKRLKPTRAHRCYKVRARKVHPNHEPVSYPTFADRIKLLDPYATAMARGGRRAANATVGPTEPLKRALRHSVPFSYAHIDHALSKVWVKVHERSGKVHVERLWVTAMVDVATGAVIGRYVSLKRPSSVACAMVIRACARRFEKLPRSIMVDRGAEFLSVYFQSLLAHLGIDLFMRPSSHPRYGAEVERFNLEVAQDWWSNRPGNCVTRLAERSVSSSHSPRNLAYLSATEFLDEFDEYLSLRENKPCRDSGKSIGLALSEGLTNFPFVGVKVVVDQEFLVNSAVDVRNYSIDQSRGIHTKAGRFFSHPCLRYQTIKKSRTDVRIEPENPYLIYAKVNGEWISCGATGLLEFQTVTREKQREKALLLSDEGLHIRKIKDEVQEELIAKQIDIDEARQTESDTKEFSVSEADFVASLFLESDRAHDLPQLESI